jgi:hypothetical protein
MIPAAQRGDDMALQVVGVGLGRTGTNSLKLALEQLLGGRCHHMHEVLARPELIPLWTEAQAGRPDWPAIFDGDVATVDWPAASFWREITDEYPDALVLLSKRADAEEWWTSASRTIFAVEVPDAPPDFQAWLATVNEIIGRVGIDSSDRDAAMAAYDRHLEEVRAAIPPERLVEWTTGDGWAPLCAALGVPVPTEPFPHTNTTAEFRAVLGLPDPE